MTKTHDDWEDVLQAAAAFQGVVDGTTLVGGTASALYAKHRMSFGADHIVEDLPQRFDQLIEQLELRGDWATAKLAPPKLMLGDFHGVETGIRQLRRERPLDTTRITINGGKTLTVPTPEEMLRIKGWLVVTRNKVRDYLDMIALADYLGEDQAQNALSTFDECYLDIYHANRGRAVSPLMQLARQMEDPAPSDLDTGLEVAHYKGIAPPWSDWNYIVHQCHALGDRLIDTLTDNPDIDDEADGPTPG